MSTRAAIYCRISKDREKDPAKRGLGVERQEHECRELAERRGLDVVGVFSDNDVSAYSGKRRPEWERLVDDIKAGVIDVVVAWAPDRLTRSTKELEALIDLLDAHRVDVVTVMTGQYDLTTPGGRLVARQIGAVARYESELKSGRIKLKQGELARNGRSTEDRCPTGTDSSAKVRLTSRPVDRADRAGDGAADHRGLVAAGIERDLNARGVPAPAGGKWRYGQVRRVLLTPSIAGLRKYQGEAVGKAGWDEIVARSTWEPVSPSVRPGPEADPPGADLHPVGLGVHRGRGADGVAAGPVEERG